MWLKPGEQRKVGLARASVSPRSSPSPHPRRIEPIEHTLRESQRHEASADVKPLFEREARYLVADRTLLYAHDLALGAARGFLVGNLGDELQLLLPIQVNQKDAELWSAILDREWQTSRTHPLRAAPGASLGGPVERRRVFQAGPSDLNESLVLAHGN
jgi:hypothetical protein